MPATRRDNPAITQFIIQNLEKYDSHIATKTAHHFGVSRVTANQYLRKLIAAGWVKARGSTKGRHYQLTETIYEAIIVPLNQPVAEDSIWRQNLLPYFHGINQPVVDICYYAICELIHNAFIFADCAEVSIQMTRNARCITLRIRDVGRGILNHLCEHFRFADAHEALLHLIKGKLTSQPQTHQGESLFFISRLFERFGLISANLFYSRVGMGNEQIVECQERKTSIKGTYFYFEIPLQIDYCLRDVQQRFQNANGNFVRTEVPVNLLRYQTEELMTRSQAQKLLRFLENFKEIVLDFQGILQMGNSFQDEIFRVFQQQHPDLVLKIKHYHALDKIWYQSTEFTAAID